jgi:hypothetical protein
VNYLEIYIVAIVLMVLGSFFYAQAKLKNKSFCTFRRANGTKYDKLVTTKGNYIIEEDGRYNIEPSRRSLYWFARGIHQFFPQWIPSYDFSFDSPHAMDPKDFHNTWDTPQTRNASSQADSFRAFARGIQSQTGKKSGLPEWLFPVIIIGLICLLGYWIYQMSGQIAQLFVLLQQR